MHVCDLVVVCTDNRLKSFPGTWFTKCWTQVEACMYVAGILELSIPNRFCVCTSCLVLFPHKSHKNRAKLFHLLVVDNAWQESPFSGLSIVNPVAQSDLCKPGENYWISWVLERSQLRALFSFGLSCRVKLFAVIKESSVCYRPQQPDICPERRSRGLAKCCIALPSSPFLFCTSLLHLVGGRVTLYFLQHCVAIFLIWLLQHLSHFSDLSLGMFSSQA